MNKDTKIIAVAGKGGVGKTSVSAAIVKQLVKAYPDKRILAIDADPAVGLSTALAVETSSTVDDIRKAIVGNAEKGNAKEAVELLGEARFRIFDAMVEKDGFSFIAVGRPESAGCYCKVNAYLKEIISILSEEFDFVIIDGEAGIEQINRRVMERVTHLILITDPSKKGTQVIRTIKDVADELVMYNEAGVIVNRLYDVSLKNLIDAGNLPVLAYIGNDEHLASFDVRGISIFELPENSAVIRGAGEALSALKLI